MNVREPAIAPVCGGGAGVRIERGLAFREFQ